MSGCFCSGRCGGDPAKCLSVGVTMRDIREALEGIPTSCCGECGLPAGHEPCDGGIVPFCRACGSMTIPVGPCENKPGCVMRFLG